MARQQGISLAIWTLLFAFVAAQTPDDQCFWKAGQNPIAEGDGWYACNNTAKTAGGAQLCCIKGSQCGEDSLCHYPSGSNGGSGWYLGGCTDGSYNDAVCPRACTDFDKTWVQYNNTEQRWRCCGDDICNGTPADEGFTAVAPDQWSAVPSAATSTASHTATATSNGPASTATSNNSGNNTNNANSNSNQNTNKSSGLSTGAQAGIGVGVGIAGLALIGAIAFWFYRRNNGSKKRSDAEAEQMMQHNGYGNHHHDQAAPAYPGSPGPYAQEYKQPMAMELPPEERAELGGGVQSPQELAAGHDEPRELSGEGRQ